jgi:hypothetical protein
MTRKDYQLHAKLIGHALACAYHSAASESAASNREMKGRDACDGLSGCHRCAQAGERARTLTYENVYEAFCAVARLDNPRFDETRFAYATAQAEQRFMENLRGI